MTQHNFRQSIDLSCICQNESIHKINKNENKRKQICKTCFGKNEFHSLDLAPIGNCNVHFLVNPKAEIVYGCLPTMNSPPIFNKLINSSPESQQYSTYFSIEIKNFDKSISKYFKNSAILTTSLYDDKSNYIRITDFCPLYKQNDRLHNCPKLIRQIKSYGSPLIKIIIRIATGLGEIVKTPDITSSTCIDFPTENGTMTLWSNVSPVIIKNESYFLANKEISLVLAPKQYWYENVVLYCQSQFELTCDYWEKFTKSLFLPLEYQREVIRAAITLKLCQNRGTGGIVAALTTSIPECGDNSGRNWDYRFCWIRDSHFIVSALNKLGLTSVNEGYLDFILNILQKKIYSKLQPMYGIYYEDELEEIEVKNLSGFQGFGPVRLGNGAYNQAQHDIYGSLILAVKRFFFDKTLKEKRKRLSFIHLEKIAKVAYSLYNCPDAGIWELRGKKNIHTYSAMMCWVACNSLSQISEILRKEQKRIKWEKRACEIEEYIRKYAWSEKFQTFLGICLNPDKEDDKKVLEELIEEDLPLDATLLLLGTMGFCRNDDVQYLKTIECIEKNLIKNNLIYRYKIGDDFGKPQNSFVLCNFWYINALNYVGRKEEAKILFENILRKTNVYGILSEDIDFETGELWGNIPQAYSMVGIIESALELSKTWREIGL